MSALSFSRFFQGQEHQPFHLNGGRPGAVLVHGFPGTPAEMLPLGQLLHQTGWTVRGILLPGFGPQIDWLFNSKHTAWIEAVTATLQEMSSQHHPLLLVGFSLGAALALQVAAVQNPAGVVLLAPFFKLNSFLWSTLPLTRRLFPTFHPFRLIKLDFSSPEMRKGIQEFMPGVDMDDPAVQQAIRDFEVPVAIFDEIRQAGVKAGRSARRLHIPSLVIQGAQDELVKPEQTQKLIKVFPVPTQYVQVAAAHNLLDPSRPAWFQLKTAILQFAGEIARSG